MSNPVLDGIEPLMSFTIHTEQGPMTVGQIWCKDGVFSFEGHVEVSAKIFADMLCDMLNNPKKYDDGRIVLPNQGS